MYYNPNPRQSFSDPASFSQGQLIATLNSVQWMSTVGSNGGAGSGTFTLASSSDFTIAGQTYNMASLGNSVTLVLAVGSALNGTTAVPLTAPFGGFALSTGSIR